MVPERVSISEKVLPRDTGDGDGGFEYQRATASGEAFEDGPLAGNDVLARHPGGRPSRGHLRYRRKGPRNPSSE